MRRATEGRASHDRGFCMTTATMAFLDRTYDEAKHLLAEAREYMRGQEPLDRAAMAPAEALRALSEGMRVATRLTEVMAWSMTQQAFYCGEITREEAADPKRRLGGQRICLDESLPGEGEMPPKLASLMERSLSLYLRAQRLDRLAAGEEMQFGSFQICIASSLDAPAEQRPARNAPQQILLA